MDGIANMISLSIAGFLTAVLFGFGFGVGLSLWNGLLALIGAGRARIGTP